MYIAILVRYPLILSDFNELEFSRQFRKVLEHKIS